MSKDRYQERHDKYVAKLRQKLLDSEYYDIVGTFLNYYTEDKLTGEIDVYGIRLRESQLDIYEVKGSKSGKYKAKGKRQLERSHEFFAPGFKQINTYLEVQGKPAL